MSTRQNKKQRKGRNNANNRERTVTTLTEDPNTHYLIPTPSEEPAGSHITTQFAGAVPVGGKIHNMSMGPQPYQIPGNFGFGYPTSFIPIQHTNMHQQQQQQQSQQQSYYPPSPSSQHQPPPLSAKPALPPGKNDLEILQNLKKIIKDGQHPFYRAVPSPAALASLYKGTIPTEVQPATTIPSSNHSSNEASTKQSPIQGKDSPPTSANRARSQELNVISQIQSKNASASSVANLKLGKLKISRESSGPPSASLQHEFESSDPTKWDVASGVADVSDLQHPGKLDYSTHSRFERNDSSSMDIELASRNLSPGSSDVGNPDKDDLIPPGIPRMRLPPNWRRAYTPNPYYVDDVNDPPFEGVRADDHDLPTERVVTPNPYHAGINVVPFQGAEYKTVPTNEGYARENDYSMRREWYPNNERRVIYDRPRDAPSDELPPLALRAATELPVPLEAQRPDVRPPATVDVHGSSPQVSDIPSAQGPDTVPPPIESQLRHDAGPDSHAPTSQAEHLGPDMEDIQSSRASSAPPADTTGAPAPVPPATSGDNLVPSTAPSMPPPSLKERINQPAPPQTKARSEAPPAGPGQHPPHPERFHKKKFQKGHHFNGPGKFGRQGTSTEGAQGHGPRTFHPRSPSLDVRKARDYRGMPPGRAVSRDRGNYRPDFLVPPRLEGAEPDVPPPARYDGRSYNGFSPPPTNERRPSAYTDSPPPLSSGRGSSGLEGPPGRGDYYSQYPPPSSREDWESEDYYKSRGWDRPPPGSEREHFERESYPSRAASWDVRQEREFIPRDGYPPLGGPPGDDRYQPGAPIPRDGDRSSRPPPGGYNPPYGRVRGRSPSPLGRPGAAPIDDSRPPMKRAREEFPLDYYPSSRAPARRPPPSDYPPPRSGSGDWPPPPSGSSSVLGAGPPPPPGSGRDYRMHEAPLEYGPPGYDRPRSPPVPQGRPSYGRGGYVRGPERGAYGGRPPQ